MSNDLPTIPDMISIVVPLFNEASHVSHSLTTILACAKESGATIDVLAVNDGSSDGTSRVVAGLMTTHPELRLLSFTRNFGKEAALYAGLQHARGACAVVIDGDLQHPPSLIPQMINAWRAQVGR